MSALYRILAALGVCAAFALAGYGIGRMHERALKAEQRVDAAVETIERHDQAAIVGNKVERKAVVAAKRTDAWFAGLKRETPHATIDSTTDCRLDAARLRRWAAVNAGPDAAAPGEPDDAGRSAPAAGERIAGGPVRQSPGIDAPLLADACELPGPDRMAGGDQ